MGNLGDRLIVAMALWHAGGDARQPDHPLRARGALMGGGVLMRGERGDTEENNRNNIRLNVLSYLTKN